MTNKHQDALCGGDGDDFLIGDFADTSPTSDSHLPTITSTFNLVDQFAATFSSAVVDIEPCTSLNLGGLSTRFVTNFPALDLEATIPLELTLDSPEDGTHVLSSGKFNTTLLITEGNTRAHFQCAQEDSDSFFILGAASSNLSLARWADRCCESPQDVIGFASDLAALQMEIIDTEPINSHEDLCQVRGFDLAVSFNSLFFDILVQEGLLFVDPEGLSDIDAFIFATDPGQAFRANFAVRKTGAAAHINCKNKLDDQFAFHPLVSDATELVTPDQTVIDWIDSCCADADLALELAQKALSALMLVEEQAANPDSGGVLILTNETASECSLSPGEIPGKVGSLAAVCIMSKDKILTSSTAEYTLYTTSSSEILLQHLSINRITQRAHYTCRQSSDPLDPTTSQISAAKSFEELIAWSTSCCGNIRESFYMNALIQKTHFCIIEDFTPEFEDVDGFNTNVVVQQRACFDAPGTNYPTYSTAGAACVDGLALGHVFSVKETGNDREFFLSSQGTEVSMFLATASDPVGSTARFGCRLDEDSLPSYIGASASLDNVLFWAESCCSNAEHALELYTIVNRCQVFANAPVYERSARTLAARETIQQLALAFTENYPVVFEVEELETQTCVTTDPLPSVSVETLQVCLEQLPPSVRVTESGTFLTMELDDHFQFRLAIVPLGTEAHIICKDDSGSTVGRIGAVGEDLERWAASCCQATPEIEGVFETLSTCLTEAPPLDLSSIPCNYRRNSFLNLEGRECNALNPALCAHADNSDFTTLKLASDSSCDPSFDVRTSNHLRYEANGRLPEFTCATNQDHVASAGLSVRQLLLWNTRCCRDSDEMRSLILESKMCVPTTIRAHLEVSGAELLKDVLNMTQVESVTEGSSTKRRCANPAPGAQFECSVPPFFELPPAPEGTSVFVNDRFMPRAYDRIDGLGSRLARPYLSPLTIQRQYSLSQTGTAAIVEMAEFPILFHSAFVPGIFHQSRQLPGSDVLTGGLGDDILVGDNAIITARFDFEEEEDEEVRSLLEALRESIGGVQLRMSVLNLDVSQWERLVLNFQQAKTIPIGLDNIDGGLGSDLAVGDNWVLVNSLAPESLPNPTDFVAQLRVSLALQWRIMVNLDFALYEMQNTLLATFLSRESQIETVFASGIQGTLLVNHDIVRADSTGPDVAIGDSLIVVSGRTDRSNDFVNSTQLMTTTVEPRTFAELQVDTRAHILDVLQPSVQLSGAVNRIPDLTIQTTSGNDDLVLSNSTLGISGNAAVLVGLITAPEQSTDSFAAFFGAVGDKGPAFRLLTEEPASIARATIHSNNGIFRIPLYSCRACTADMVDEDLQFITSLSQSDTIEGSGTDLIVAAVDFAFALGVSTHLPESEQLFATSSDIDVSPLIGLENFDVTSSPNVVLDRFAGNGLLQSTSSLAAALCFNTEPNATLTVCDEASVIDQEGDWWPEFKPFTDRAINITFHVLKHTAFRQTYPAADDSEMCMGPFDELTGQLLQTTCNP